MADQAGTTRALDVFSAPTRAWFEAAFAEPTPAQVGAWSAIAAGRNALVVAPTGSGKTLSAFLWSLDQIATAPPAADKRQRCRVLYVSPLKALAVDVERNLRAPLTGIRHTAERLGETVPEITVGVRSGDTSAADRRRLGTTPPDILITTPESLFLMLTCQARESLRGVETVIVDEVHAVAGTKRGAHLALSLERLDELLERPAQRIGLSATVRPVEEVARFLGGPRAGRGGRTSLHQGVGPPGRGPGRGHDRARRRHRRGPRGLRGGAGQPRLDLAARRGARRRPHRGTPLHDRLRQLPPTGRAAHRPAQRDRHGARRGHPRARRCSPGGGDGPVGAEPRRPGGDRPRPPRFGVQGPARAHRGRPQARSAPLRGRHLEPRARHRHGRGRPRRADREPAVGGQRPPAGRPCRPPGRRGLPRRAPAQAPQRPGPHRGVSRAHARSAPSSRCTSRPTRSTCSPSRSSPSPRSTSGTSTSSSPSYAGRHPSPRCPGRPTTPPSTCSAAATPPTSSPSCGRGSSGTASPAPSADDPAPSDWPSPAAAPSPTAASSGSSSSGRRPRRVGELDEEMVYESRVGDVFALGATSLAHRGHHPRPRAGLPRARPARPAAVLEGRPDRPSRGARRGHRRVHPRAVGTRPPRRPSPGAATPGSTPGPRTTW